MLFDFSKLKQKYKFNITGILHVGGHLAEEALAYHSNGIFNVLWIEANEQLVDAMRQKRHTVLQGLIDEQDDKIVNFNITNNGESSSILEFGSHSTEHPHIHVIEKRPLKTVRLDTLLSRNNVNLTQFNFINLDIQGKELSALKSLGNLDHVDYIYTEVNEKELYLGCCLMPELDSFLKDFERVETKILVHGWGDALYIRKRIK